MKSPRLISFFLPQFHPIPENDEWWGKGFTEWTNVTKARPMFEGHQQPKLPADLGFYDLRLPEIRNAQAQLAQQYGVHGFCYYHYWFNGRRLLERPVNEILASGQPDFPFCLCWANENWTRAWDGLEKQVLIGQRYNPEDDRAHLRWLAQAFRDPRYIRVHGKPLFLVYRAQSLPDPAQTAALWREEARRLGLGELFLCAVESRVGGTPSVNPAQFGFDAAVEFQPDGLHFPKPVRPLDQYGGIFDYQAVVEKMLAKPGAEYLRFPCVAPGWDNSPRRKNNPTILQGNTPQLYERWLQAAVEKQQSRHPEEQIVFINAWNEWAEGACLEPDQIWGHEFLQATHRVQQRFQKAATAQPTAPVEIAPDATPSVAPSATPKFTASPISGPPVSVCIPVYNGNRYLREAIRSVLAQTYQDFELLIVDDCSPEPPDAVVREFSDPRLRLYRNEARQGLVGNWNRCVELAQGTLVTLFHQDDWMHPQNLERKVALLAAHPHAGLVYSDARVVEADRSVRQERWFTPTEPNVDQVMPGLEFFRKLIEGENLVCCPGVMIRKACFTQLGGFNTELPYTTDWEMWLRVALHFDAGYLAERLIDYRVHETNETHRFKGLKELRQSLRAKQLALEQGRSILPQHADLWRKVHLDMARKALTTLGKAGQNIPSEELRACLEFAANTRRAASPDATFDQAVDWFLGAIEQLHLVPTASEQNEPPLSSEAAKEFEHARALEKQQKVPEALAILEKLCAAHPSSIRLWAELARAQMASGRLAPAEQAWTVAIQNSPVNWAQKGWALAMRGRTREASKRNAEALADFAQAAHLALRDQRPNHACEIDEWMRLMQEGQRIPPHTQLGTEQYERFCKASPLLQTIGLAIGRNGIVSTRELSAADGLWRRLLNGAAASRIEVGTDIIATLARQHLEVSLERQEDAEVERIRQAWPRFLSAADPAGIPTAIRADMDRLLRQTTGRTPEVTIVIPTFNRLDLTRQCLESLRQHTRGVECEIVVVDNGSTDGTPAFLREEQTAGRLRAVLNEENLGFARACNLGAKAAQAAQVLFLNNDTEARGAWLEPMLARLRDDQRLGAVGAKLLFPDGTIQHAGVALLEDRQLPDPLVARHIHYHKPGEAPETNVPCLYQALTAACLLVRKPIFEEVGGFDEGYWNGYEDIDLCLSIGQAGYTLLYEPSSVLIHHESQSGPERFRKVGPNIQRLHDKWLGRAAVDYVVETNGEVARTAAGRIAPYAPKPKDSSTPLVSIIVLTYNQLEHTRLCFESLLACTSLPYELIVVDNGSTDGTVEFLRQFLHQSAAAHRHTTVIANGTNLGFAAGNNQGLAIARGECVLLLNNDTVLTPGWLEGMLAALQSRPEIGVVGPMSNYVAGAQLAAKPAYQNLQELPAFARRFHEENRGQVQPANRVVGFCLLARRSLVERIGGLDEQFGSGNFEDDDFCIRALLAGFEVVIARGVFVHHTGSQTFKGAGIDYRASMMRNWDLFCRKWKIISTIEQGYPTPRALPPGAALRFDLPALSKTHVLAAGLESWWEESEKNAGASAVPPAAGSVAARVGNLDGLAELLREKKLHEAWLLVVDAIAQRPFHPEGYLKLAEIAHAAGDVAKARQAAEQAGQMAPGWKLPRKFLKSLPGKGTPRIALPDLPKPNQKPRLSVCLIVRNEERFLEQCLASVRPIASQIVVVDTGSADRTVEIAARFGAEIHHFAWCDDFSAARNAALQHATGDWVLSLDADEELTDETRRQLQRECQNREVMAYRLPIIDQGREEEGRSYVPRLFRNAPGISFSGRIHEQAFSSFETRAAEWGLAIKLGSAVLTHHGYSAEMNRTRDKVARNLALLRRAISENRQDPNLLMNLGLELVRDGRLDQGLEEYWKAFHLLQNRPATASPEMRETFLTQFCTYLLRAKRTAAIADALASPLARSAPLSATLHYLAALAAMERGEFAAAIPHLRECLARRHRPALAPIHTGITTTAPAHCLATCLHATGDFTGATKAFTSVLQEDPKSVPIRLDFARLLRDRGEPVEALKLLHQVISDAPGERNAWTLGSEIALSHPNFFEFALDWTSEACLAIPGEIPLRLHRVDALFLNDRLDDACTVLDASETDLRDSVAALCRKIALQLVRGETPEVLAGPTSEPASQEFLRYYRLLIDRGANAQLERINSRLDRLADVLPEAGEALQAALCQAAA